MTCIVNVNGDYSDLSARDDLKLRMCNLDIPEDAHQGRGHYNETLCRNLGGREGGGGGGGGEGLVGHYTVVACQCGLSLPVATCKLSRLSSASLVPRPARRFRLHERTRRAWYVSSHVEG